MKSVVQMESLSMPVSATCCRLGSTNLMPHCPVCQGQHLGPEPGSGLHLESLLTLRSTQQGVPPKHPNRGGPGMVSSASDLEGPSCRARQAPPFLWPGLPLLPRMPPHGCGEQHQGCQEALCPLLMSFSAGRSGH